MSTAVKIVAILNAKPGKAEALRALLVGMADDCRAEAGNLRWDVWQDQSDPNRFVLDELYTDSAAIAAHRETPHYKNYAANVPDLADRSSMKLDAVKVA